MKKERFETSHRKIVWWFIYCASFSPLSYIVFLLAALEFSQVLKLIPIIIFTSIPILIASYILLIIHNKKIIKQLRSINGKSDTSSTDELVKIINSYSFRFSLFMFIATIFASSFIPVIGFINNIFFSFEHAFLFFVIGLALALISSLYFYRISKMILYPFTEIYDFKPLSLFLKFSIPIFSSILFLFLIISIGLLISTTNETRETNKLLAETVETKTEKQLDFFFRNPLIKLEAYSQLDIIKGMDFDSIKPFLDDVHSNRDNYIEMFFISKLDGEIISSTGRNTNISKRLYFKEILRTKKNTFSDSIFNTVTKKNIIVCIIPVKSEGNIVGFFGASILIDKIRDKLAFCKKYKSLNLMLLSNAGKIIYYNNKSYFNKSMGTEIKDDGTHHKNLNKILQSNYNNFFDITFEQINRVAYKSKMNLTGYNLVIFRDKSEEFKKINSKILQIVYILICFSSLILFIILKISKKFSNPIKNTIDIFNIISNGNLQVTSSDYIPDEFGELIRFLNYYLSRIKEVIHTALESSQQLTMASESFSSTSQDLAENSQNQAAAVEEASASLEEISSSIEQISKNAKFQSDSASVTHKSMKQLKIAIQEVTSYANEALDKANTTTNEAKKGNELMQNTIKRMDRIYDSTHKISEIVGMISDISDQVNLLALNAAIEAARAGEHGRGFAVVADEISKLAEQTATSAKNITSLVKSGLEEVSKGKDYVDTTSCALINIIKNIEQTDEIVRRIVESAKKQNESSEKVLTNTKKVMEMADNISIATSEQTNTNEEMVKTIDQINEHTQSVAAGAEQISSSSEEISAQAQALNNHIKFFKINDE